MTEVQLIFVQFMKKAVSIAKTQRWLRRLTGAERRSLSHCNKLYSLLFLGLRLALPTAWMTAPRISSEPGRICLALLVHLGLDFD